MNTKNVFKRTNAISTLLGINFLFLITMASPALMAADAGMKAPMPVKPQQHRPLRAPAPADDPLTGIGKLESLFKQLAAAQNRPADRKQRHQIAGQAIRVLDRLRNSLAKTANGFDNVGDENKKRRYTRTLRELVKQLEDLRNTLATQDKMGNFDVQELMSRTTQARNLADRIKSATDEQKESITGKMK